MNLFGFDLSLKRSSSRSIISDIAAHAGKLGIEICDVSGHVEEVSSRVAEQAQVCHTLRESAAVTMRGNQRIAEAAQQVRTVSGGASAAVVQSKQTLEGNCTPDAPARAQRHYRGRPRRAVRAQLRRCRG
jgi:methyl-accepting chemotaxis protein